MTIGRMNLSAFGFSVEVGSPQHFVQEIGRRPGGGNFEREFYTFPYTATPTGPSRKVAPVSGNVTIPIDGHGESKLIRKAASYVLSDADYAFRQQKRD